MFCTVPGNDATFDPSCSVRKRKDRRCRLSRYQRLFSSIGDILSMVQVQVLRADGGEGRASSPRSPLDLASGADAEARPRRIPLPNRKWAKEKEVAKVVAALPCGPSEHDSAARRELFYIFDPNRKGRLAEDDALEGVRRMLKTSGLGSLITSPRSIDVAHADPEVMLLGPAMRRAFQSVTLAKDHRRPNSDLVLPSEFRQLLTYFKWYYANLLRMFLADGADPSSRPVTAHPTPVQSPRGSLSSARGSHSQSARGSTKVTFAREASGTSRAPRMFPPLGSPRVGTPYHPSLR